MALAPLTTENTCVVLDSTSDRPPAEFPANWRHIPLSVRFGTETLRDYVDITPTEFYRRLPLSRELPKTSQPSAGEFAELYASLAGYERVYSIHLSGKLSGTIESANLAASEHPNVTVVDTHSVSVVSGMVADRVQELLGAGTTHDEIMRACDASGERSGVVVYLDTIEYLVKGGRIGRAQSIVGGLLKVRPILEIAGGEVVARTRVRSRARAFTDFAAFLRDSPPAGGTLRVSVATAAMPDIGTDLAQLVRETRPDATLARQDDLGPVIGTYGGPGCMGVAYFSAPD